MKSNKIIRILAGLLGVAFLAVSPLFYLGMDGSRKFVVIPIVGFGLLFLIHSFKGRKP